MRLIIKQSLDKPLILPVNHQHILQSIIYHNLKTDYGFSEQLHDEGYLYGKRHYKLFTFSWLQGKYEYSVEEKKITFYDEVTLEVRSPDLRMIQVLTENIKKNGITYGENHVTDVKLILDDESIEAEQLHIKMKTPVCVYSTKREDHFTTFYSPKDPEFFRLINENFYRKYYAYYGVYPEYPIEMIPVKVTNKDKKIVKYQSCHICGWKGDYILKGKRKYLDFLYQTGIGCKNSQGFGMWTVYDEKKKEQYD